MDFFEAIVPYLAACALLAGIVLVYAAWQLAAAISSWKR